MNRYVQHRLMNFNWKQIEQRPYFRNVIRPMNQLHYCKCHNSRFVNNNDRLVLTTAQPTQMWPAFLKCRNAFSVVVHQTQKQHRPVYTVNVLKNMNVGSSLVAVPNTINLKLYRVIR